MLSSIKTKVILFSVILTLVIVGFQYIPNQKSNDKLIEHSQKNLKSIGDVAYKVIVNDVNKDLSNSELKQKIKSDFSKIKIGKEGFAFILNSEGTFVLHPKTENQNWKDKDFVKQMMDKKSGFIEYISPKTGKGKYVYFKHCKKRDWIVAVSMWADEFEELNAYTTSMMYISIGAAVFLLTLFFIYILRSIISPLVCFQKNTSKIAEGNYKVSFNIKRKDEIGKLSMSLSSMVQNIVRTLTEVEEQKEAAEKSQEKVQEFNEQIKREQQDLSDATLELKSAMEALANGDLTISVNENNKESNLKILFSSFNKTVIKIKSILWQLKETVNTTAMLTSEISNNSVQMATNANEENSQINDVASAVEEISQTIVQTSANAHQAYDSANKAKDEAQSGTTKVADSMQGMSRIADSSKNVGEIIASLANKTDQIGDIANVINDIADQTNLLALNAAIEAARAGEQGRGFAVVADEVRKLAERTTIATKEISETIQSVQSEAREANKAMENTTSIVAEGMDLADGVDNALKLILKNVDAVTEQINNVAAAGEEESTASELISRNLDGINNLSGDNTNMINGIANSAEQLSTLTTDLENLIQEFSIGEKKDVKENTYHEERVLVEQ